MCSQMFLSFKLLTDFIFMVNVTLCPETLEKWTQFKKQNKKEKYETSEIQKKNTFIIKHLKILHL